MNPSASKWRGALQTDGLDLADSSVSLRVEGDTSTTSALTLPRLLASSMRTFITSRLVWPRLQSGLLAVPTMRDQSKDHQRSHSASIQAGNRSSREKRMRTRSSGSYG